MTSYVKLGCSLHYKKSEKDPDQCQGIFYNCVPYVPVELFTHSGDAHVTGRAAN